MCNFFAVLLRIVKVNGSMLSFTAVSPLLKNFFFFSISFFLVYLGIKNLETFFSCPK